MFFAMLLRCQAGITREPARRFPLYYERGAAASPDALDLKAESVLEMKCLGPIGRRCRAAAKGLEDRIAP